MTGEDLIKDFKEYLSGIRLSKKNQFGIINRYIAVRHISDYRVTEMLNTIYDMELKATNERGINNGIINNN